MSVNSVRFDTTGFSIKEKTNDAITWANPQGDTIEVSYSNSTPNLPCNLTDVKGIRDYNRQLVTQVNGGLVSSDVISIERSGRNLQCTQSIYKLAQKPEGMHYTGMLLIPFADCSYIINVQCNEKGVTGMRDAMVLEKMMAGGNMEFDRKTGGIKDWVADPYDPAAKTPLMRNKSEDEKYDAQFPDHPLSRCRSLLKYVGKTLQLDDSVLQSRPFNARS